MGRCIGHEPCPECGSKDNLARYEDGSAHCFGCQHYEKADGQTRERVTEDRDWTPTHGDVRAIPKRALSKETCAFANYQVGDKEQIANHYEDGELIGQKFRLPGKEFRWKGRPAPFYLSWKWSRGKHLVITEGEIDALAMLEAFDCKWPVVSLTDGVGSVEKNIEAGWDFLQNFERIVLMFDMDKPGREAVEKAAQMLPAGRVAVAQLPEKDADEVLCKHGKAALISAFWNAKIWQPDGIKSGAEFTLEMIDQGVSVGYELPYPDLQEKVYGIRKGELTLLTAGSGIGKSTWAREIAYGLHQTHGCGIGNVYLEEQNVKTVQAYVAIDNNVPLGKLRHRPDILTQDQKQASLQKVVHQRMWFYDHFGSLDSNNLISRLRYFAKVLKVDFIVLDHISIVTSGLESSSEGERKDIDILMTKLQQLIQETGVGIIAIVHLKRVTGVSFNDGGQISLSHLRGSGSLEQLSDNVYALERDQQAEGPEKYQMRVRVLKCRETGDTGESDLLRYDRETGRVVVHSVFDDVETETTAEAAEAL